MNGNPKVLAAIKSLLPLEATAMAQFRAQAQMFRNWGYLGLKHPLHHKFYAENHANKKLLNRLLEIGGETDAADYAAIPNIGSDVVSMLTNDYTMSVQAIDAYNAAITVCEDAGDHVSGHKLGDLLRTRSKQAHWFEVQLRLISDLGKSEYLSHKVKE